jgi:hypothetical protein
LGLKRSFVNPVLTSIRQLQEVDSLFSDNNFRTKTTIENLNRAEEIFSSFSKGGREHLAVYALLAECQHRLALYEDSIKTLNEMQTLLQDGMIPHSGEDLTLARAKASWFAGKFDQSQELCESIISTYNDLDETFPTTNLHLAAAMSGKALSQLASMKTLDDAYSVRDYFRITTKFLERHPPNSNTLPQAVAFNNCGTAEAIYALFLEETNNVSVPMDAALRCWFQGLQQIGEEQNSEHLKWGSNTLQANIQGNLAWGVLNYETDRSDRLKKASDYAKKALAAHTSGDEEGMRRVLSIVASCYHQAGSAVTAEGLFQSAIDRKNILPGINVLLELQDAQLGYAGLCRQWEKREGDATRLEAEANELNDQLPNGWKGKSGIHSTLWFWTPSDFL